MLHDQRNREVRIFPDIQELSRSAAAQIAELLERRFDETGSATLALSGGQTPRSLYTILSTEYRDTIPWKGVHFFWGDERYVPKSDPESNYRAVEESLLRNISLPDSTIHAIPTDLAT